MGYDNRLLVGVVAGSIFMASTLGHFMPGTLPLTLPQVRASVLNSRYIKRSPKSRLRQKLS